ncbi:Lnb N-terminal periplasmic domain-containing protein [Acinetobacter sp. WZC-1]|uniref:Lnb N-terminal periplasmic domain-containing protein n=1 Tax=Acinetobacter sp. WZC-1 TaxID=3459034 RepID=UPI00403D5CCB
MHNIGKTEFLRALGTGLIHSLFSLFVILSSIWLCLAVWIQQPGGWLLSRIIIGLWIAFALSILGIYISQHFFSRRKDISVYMIAIACSLVWYFNIPARQDRDWSPDVARILSYEKHGNGIVTLHNIRNFTWYSEDQSDPHWDSRTYNLNHIRGINIITSYWMGPQIAHTLVSFDFTDQRPLVFSIEVRKEKTEGFSAIGGFFRQFELSLIAADEKDIIYTRSNVRGEQVYFFPINMPKAEMQALFLEYLKKSDELRAQPRWYNTLTSNCTTLVFDMIQAIDPHKLPRDYRLLASGYLPNYLYDLGALDHHWSIREWYQHAHINPKTAGFDHTDHPDSLHFSRLIRTGLMPVSAPADSFKK